MGLARRAFARHGDAEGAPRRAAILLPVAYFLSVLSPEATEPNPLIYLAVGGAVILAAGLFTLGVGLLRTPRPSDSTGEERSARPAVPPA